MRPIKNHPNYFISSTGKVWSRRRKLFLRPGVDSGGYLLVVLCEKGAHETRNIHRLVLETFRGPCPKGMECRHLDGNSVNNNLDNLKWGTHSENIQDAVQHGTWHALKRLGEKHPNSKLSDFERRLIHNSYRHGGCTQQELADEFEAGLTQVNRIVHDNRWEAVHV